MAIRTIAHAAVSYPDAEIRGRLRQWKTGLLTQHQRFERACKDRETLQIAGQFALRSTRIGRQRAFSKLVRRLGPGALLEGVRFDGGPPLAVWATLRARVSVLATPVGDTHGQDCVTVNYAMAGVMPWSEDLKTIEPGIRAGLWTLEVPDHALGRVLARSKMTPSAIIMAAHHNLLGFRLDQESGGVHDERKFLVRAGPGGFVCQFMATPRTEAGDITFYVRAWTWLHDDMLHNDQVPQLDDGLPGERLRDGWLLPTPLRRITWVDNHMALTCGSIALPERPPPNRTARGLNYTKFV